MPEKSGEINLNLHHKQALALNTEANEVLFGGSAGGGKSHSMRSGAILWCTAIAGLQVYLFRRIREDLVKNHMEGPKGFRAMLAPWVQAGFVVIVEDEIRFWNGSKIYLCHCKDAKDIYKYQGAEIHVLLIDELTHWQEDMYRFLRNRVRMVGIDLPEGYEGRFPRIFCSANPGNIGHQFVKTTFIDDCEPMRIRQMPQSEGGMKRQFIPARLEDNPSMIEDDPGYEQRLMGLGSEALVKAMRFGDWSVVDGAFFDCWSSERHVVRPFTIPPHWTRIRGMDWGSAAPFSVGWYAVVSEALTVENSTGGKVHLPRGCLVQYREWYGATKPNVGLKLTAEVVGAGVAQRDNGDHINDEVLDPAAFAQDGGPSIAEKIYEGSGKKVNFRRADNTRVGRRGAMGGWDLVRARLVGDGDGNPMLVFFSTCVNLIRTLPVIQHDNINLEDLNCWVAGTMISTPRGNVPIEVLRRGDFVTTPLGRKRVLKAHVSGLSQTIKVEMSNGVIMEGTPDHKIYIHGRGLIALDNVERYDIPLLRNMSWRLRPLYIAASFIGAMKEGYITTQTGQFLLRVAQVYVAKYGLMRAGIFLSAGIYTILTETMTTTSFQTLNAPPMESIPSTTPKKNSLLFRPGSPNGERALKEERLYGRTLLKCSSELPSANYRVAIVESILKLDTLRKYFAPLNVLMNRTLARLTRVVKYAEHSSGLSETRQKKSEPVHIIAVGHCAERTPVFNLTVEDAHLFYANGVLSSNTDMEDHALDQTRYVCASRPWTAPTVVVTPIRGASEMTMREAWSKAKPKSVSNGRI